MKYLITIILILSFNKMVFPQSSNLLETPISIEFNQLSLKDAVDKLCKKYTLNYVMASEVQFKTITVVYKNEKLSVVLNDLIKNTNLEYIVQGNQLIFRECKKPKRKYTVNGYIEDKANKERLIGCNVVNLLKSQGTVSNSFGFFSFNLEEGINTIQFRYIGYENQTLNINLRTDTMVVVQLVPDQPVQLKEVKVTADYSATKLEQANTGVIQISRKEIKQFPSLMGTTDVLRSVQMLPGIQAASERSTGLSVRGGSIDQNLFLLDDAPVYQTSHITGLYSVFNADAIKDVKIYKGDIPANYGGRVSSLVDIRLKDGDMQKYAVTGGIGVMATDLSVEGPIIKNKASFIVSGKYSILSNYYIQSKFYDLNFKINLIVNPKNRIYLSSYLGRDVSEIGTHFSFGNKTGSFRWNHIYNPRLFSNVTVIYSKYNYLSGSNSNVNKYFNYQWKSGITQVTLKADYTYYLEKHTIDFGLSSSYNKFNPGKLEGNINSIENISQKTPFSNRVVSNQGVLDHAIYISDQHKITDRLTLRYGVRASLFQNIGNNNWVFKLNNYQVTDSFKAAKNSFYHNFFNIEPRVGLNYRLSKNSSLKASTTYATQQIQLLTKTNGGGPMDVWYPSGQNIKPQKQWQYSLGYTHYLFNNALEITSEVYYKNMRNIIDYKDGATFLNKTSIYMTDKTNYNFEEQLRTGKGYAYGVETTLKGEIGRLNGFISYTYSRSKRKIPGINEGETYLSPFDKPHTINIFLAYQATKRLSIAANWRYQSGTVITSPIYVMEMYGNIIKGYSNRNEYRLPSHRRFDVSLTYRGKQTPGKRFHGEWNLSVINLFDHLNYESIDFIANEDNPGKILMMGNYYYGILPSLSYRFNF